MVLLGAFNAAFWGFGDLGALSFVEAKTSLPDPAFPAADF